MLNTIYIFAYSDKGPILDLKRDSTFCPKGGK